MMLRAMETMSASGLQAKRVKDLSLVNPLAELVPDDGGGVPGKPRALMEKIRPRRLRVGVGLFVFTNLEFGDGSGEILDCLLHY